MPEGDTIHRTAAALRHVLLGRALTRSAFPRLSPPLPRIGATVDEVAARGKHLLIATSDGLTVHTHQRMTGSWHVYRPGERWRRPRGTVRAVLGVESAVAVCFASPVVEVLDTDGRDRHPALRRLGPDLCVPDADLDAVVARSRRRTNRSVAEVLLDQSVAAGIGNVYRSELLFLHRLHPGVPLETLSDDDRRALFATASRLLRDNLRTSRRTTVPHAPAGSLWVYDRAGRPCRRCGTAVLAAGHGEQARSVFWCPTCQPAPSTIASADARPAAPTPADPDGV